MTTFRCKEGDPEAHARHSELYGLSTTLAADESLEEIIVSGVKDLSGSRSVVARVAWVTERCCDPFFPPENWSLG